MNDTPTAKESQAEKDNLIKQINIAANHLLDEDPEMVDSAITVIYALCKLYRKKE